VLAVFGSASSSCNGRVVEKCEFGTTTAGRKRLLAGRIDCRSNGIRSVRCSIPTNGGSLKTPRGIYEVVTCLEKDVGGEVGSQDAKTTIYLVYF
jgi:hypothetical protein